jgi:hypothetical protein
MDQVTRLLRFESGAEKEAEADEDILAGRVHYFTTEVDLCDDLTRNHT